jgi:hypothetical protein
MNRVSPKLGLHGERRQQFTLWLERRHSGMDCRHTVPWRVISRLHAWLIGHRWQILVSRLLRQACDWMHLGHPCPKPSHGAALANRLSCRFVLLPGRNDGLCFNDLPHNENCWTDGVALDRQKRYSSRCHAKALRRTFDCSSELSVLTISNQQHWWTPARRDGQGDVKRPVPIIAQADANPQPCPQLPHTIAPGASACASMTAPKHTLFLT